MGHYPAILHRTTALLGLSRATVGTRAPAIQRDAVNGLQPVLPKTLLTAPALRTRSLRLHGCLALSVSMATRAVRVQDCGSAGFPSR